MRLGERTRGVLDYNYVAYFPIYQKQTIQDMIRYVNQSHDVTPIANLMNIFENFESQHEQEMWFRDRIIEPNEVHKEEDVLTLPGLTECINAIRGTVAPWRYMGIGATSNAANATVGDTVLDSELTPRLDMSIADVGWREVLGMKIFYGCMIGESRSTGTIKELAVFRSSSAGSMLNHTRFANAGFTKIVDKQLGIVAAVIELCPAVA